MSLLCIRISRYCAWTTRIVIGVAEIIMGETIEGLSDSRFERGGRIIIVRMDDDNFCRHRQSVAVTNCKDRLFFS